MPTFGCGKLTTVETLFKEYYMSKTKEKITIPTYLTIARMVLAMLFVLLIMVPEGWVKAFALMLFLIAAVTDKIDGHLARETKTVTELGAFLDPIADKMLVNLGFLALVALHVVPVWVFAVILVRDFAVDGLRMISIKKGKDIPSSLLGKTKTTAQMIALGVLLFSVVVDFDVIRIIGNILLYIALIMTVASGAGYFYNARQKHII